MAIYDVMVAVDEATYGKDLHVLRHGATEDSFAAGFARTLHDTALKENPDAERSQGPVPVTQAMRDAAERVIRSKLVAFVIKDKDLGRILVFNDGSALPIDTFLCGNGVGCFTRLGKIKAS